MSLDLFHISLKFSLTLKKFDYIDNEDTTCAHLRINFFMFKKISKIR